MRPETDLLPLFIGPRRLVIKTTPSRHAPLRQIMNIRLVLLTLLLFNSSALAQDNPVNEPCMPNRSSAAHGALRWADNTRVAVYATPNNFSQAELGAIKHAIDNWNDVI